MRISFAGNIDISDVEARWTADDGMTRLWERDHSVWFAEPRPELTNRLGWLDLPSTGVRHLPDIDNLCRQATELGVTRVVLCGMGGSSLAPQVFANSLRHNPVRPDLIVLDSTHPDTVASVTDQIDIASTWFVISSKSGSTIETLSAMRYFWEQAATTTTHPGSHFIAVTDPGSPLENEARLRGFRATFLADPEVGGRYAALSAFGLVPSGLVGCDIAALLASGRTAASLCRPETPLSMNPAFMIGATLVSAAKDGSDKVRFLGSGAGMAFGAWVEQLIAESTGKSGTGIVPIDGGERRDTPDELTVWVGGPSSEREAHTSDIAVELSEPTELGGLMFVWELATAVAGAELGINPFDQPDVQRAKDLAKQAMANPVGTSQGAIDIDSSRLRQVLDGALDRIGISYVSIQAYLAADAATNAALAALRTAMTRRTGTAVTIGYGPRFLHSTGQLHKGGPPGGLFLQLTDEPRTELAVPETDFTFNELIAAQAAGDRSALAQAERVAVAIDLGTDPVAGIKRLTGIVEPIAP